ncbi:hypothetical protein GQ600_20513 [Phytophthora cactorum]|nr:hypothetical protein GQ600_20513 [Phytophthora cactorum]
MRKSRTRRARTLTQRLRSLKKLAPLTHATGLLRRRVHSMVDERRLFPNISGWQMALGRQATALTNCVLGVLIARTKIQKQLNYIQALGARGQDDGCQLTTQYTTTTPNKIVFARRRLIFTPAQVAGLFFSRAATNSTKSSLSIITVIMTRSGRKTAGTGSRTGCLMIEASTKLRDPHAC